MALGLRYRLVEHRSKFMRTLNWRTPKQLKQAIYLIGLAFVLSTTVACDKKKDKATASYRNNRGVGYNNLYNGSNGYQQSNWGAITRSGYFYSPQQPNNSVLTDFMPSATDLGYVSGNVSDNTGIRFIGNIQDGEIYILVWDEVANQTGEAYYWPMRITNQQQNGNGASLVLEDAVGRVYLDGSFSGSEWRGTAEYENFDGGRGTLGNFMIGINSVF